MVEMTFLQTKVKVIHIDTNRFFIYNLLLAVNSRLTFALEHSSRKRTKYGKKRKFEKRKKRRSNDIYAMHQSVLLSFAKWRGHYILTKHEPF